MGGITKEFIQFLIKAKRNTYAGDGKESEPSRLSSRDLHYIYIIRRVSFYISILI